MGLKINTEVGPAFFATVATWLTLVGGIFLYVAKQDSRTEVTQQAVIELRAAVLELQKFNLLQDRRVTALEAIQKIMLPMVERIEARQITEAYRVKPQ